MRINLRDLHRRRIGRTELDARQRPTRVHVDDADREVLLDWEGAVDDAGHLRKCLMCGCGDLFREKAFPQVTIVVIVLAFAGAALGVLNLVTTPILIAMAVVLVLDVAILLFSQQRLVCYRCRSTFSDLPIARYHTRWDRATADRYAPAAEPTSEGGQEPAGPEAARPTERLT